MKPKYVMIQCPMCMFSSEGAIIDTVLVAALATNHPFYNSRMPDVEWGQATFHRGDEPKNIPQKFKYNKNEARIIKDDNMWLSTILRRY